MTRFRRRLCWVACTAVVSGGLSVIGVGASNVGASTTATADLSSVSCPSSDFCMAVGNRYSESPVPPYDWYSEPIAERWNGTRWKIQRVSLPSGFHFFDSVSCTSPTFCLVVGYLVTLRWNGTAWHSVRSPDMFTNSVWCTRPHFCLASGYGPHQRPVVGDWNGKTWTTTVLLTPAGNRKGAIDDISCTSVAACSAVGSYYPTPGSSYLALAEGWDGTTWSVEQAVNPVGNSSVLESVSCLSSTACTAVGSYVNASGQSRTLGEVWNGSSWTLQPTRTPSGNGSSLAGVSCNTSTACDAVGQAPNNQRLAEGWDGSRWKITLDRGTGELYSASCTAPTACMAVGTLGNVTGGYPFQSIPQGALAERWNGIRWKVVGTPL